MEELSPPAGLPRPPSPDAEAGAEMLRRLVEGIDARLVATESSEDSVATPTEPQLAGTDAAVREIGGPGTLHVIFELNDTPFAVPAHLLAEVKPFEPPMPIPGAPEWVLGIESFRGEVLSITDLAGFLGLRRRQVPGRDARTLVAFDPRSPRRALTGFAVDAVTTHDWLADSPGVAGPTLEGRLGRFTRRVAHHGGRSLAVLDLTALLASEDFLDLRS